MAATMELDKDDASDANWPVDGKEEAKPGPEEQAQPEINGKEEGAKPGPEEQSKPETDVKEDDNQDEKKEKDDKGKDSENREKSLPLPEGIPSKKDLITLSEKAIELSKDVKLEDNLIKSRIEPPPSMYTLSQTDGGKNEKQDNAVNVPQLFERLMSRIGKNDLPTALEVIKAELKPLVDGQVEAKVDDPDNPEEKEEAVLRSVDRNLDVWKKNVLEIKGKEETGVEEIMIAAGFVIDESKNILQIKEKAFNKEKVQSILKLCDKTIVKCKAEGSDDGVSLKILEILNEEYKDCEEVKVSHGQSFVDSVVIPATEKDKCSYVEFLKKKGEDRKNVGRANVYVCHSWMNSIKSLVPALKKYESLRNDKVNRRYYLDYLAVNQNLSAEQRKDTYPIGNLQNILEGIEEFVLVVNDWDFKTLPIPLRRKWCLCEIAIARSADVQFFVTMPESQYEKFCSTVMFNNGLSAAAKVIQDVDIDQAEASEPLDRQILQDLVTQKYGGSEDFNYHVSNYLRWWLQRVMAEIYSNWATKKVSASKLQLQFLEQVTFFFFHWGNPEAAKYGQLGIELSRELKIDTLQKQEILAKRCINMGKFSEVIVPLQELITAAKNNLPNIPTGDDAQKIFKWVDLMVTALTRGKVENAVELKRLLSREEERLGKTKNRHLKELVRLNKIATGDFFEDALEGLEKLHKEVVLTSGGTAPISLRIRFNLIHLYAAVGKHEGVAEQMEIEFIEDATKLFGETSMHVLNVKVVHGKTLSTLGKQEDAKKIFEEVINLGTKIYGEKDSLVEKAKLELEKMEKGKEEQKEESK